MKERIAIILIFVGFFFGLLVNIKNREPRWSDFSSFEEWKVYERSRPGYKEGWGVFQDWRLNDPYLKTPKPEEK